MLNEYLDFFCRVDEVFAAVAIALLLYQKAHFVFLKGKPDPPKSATRLSGGTAILSLLSASPPLQAIHAPLAEAIYLISLPTQQ
ncbi:MAG: hypothetical protein B6D34_02980 [Candidatus Brocadia sp. UTAMX1]|jgi:hypothetical protein|nr:MAG: hypothetical protein B6D34_02980 [Candidatus Brocadia sp. UTAMX1]